jgi:hypothetical protein
MNMPVKSTEETSKSGAVTPRPTKAMDDAAALQAYGFNTMTGMGVAWMQALSEMGSEVMSFVAERIQEDVKTQHQLLHCKDVGEMQRIQSDFVRKAVEQYQAETGKLVEMSRTMIWTPDRAD